MTSSEINSNDPYTDYVYVFTVYLNRQLTQVELVNYDLDKLSKKVPGGLHKLTDPVVSILFRYERLLTDVEISVLAEGIRDALDSHKVDYEKIELVHVERADKLGGADDEGDSVSEQVAAVQDGAGDVPPASDSVE